MCVPIIGAAIGAAASVAGGVMKAQQQQDYVDSINKAKMESFNIARIAQQREDRRQDRFDKRGFKKLNQTRKDVDAESQIAAGDAAQQKFISSNEGAATAGFDAVSEDPSSGNPLVAERAKVIADAAARSRASISNLGSIVGFGQANSAANMRLNKNSDFLALFNNMRRGSLGVYEQEARVADAVPQPEPPDTTMADMLTGFGGMFNRGGGRSYG